MQSPFDAPFVDNLRERQKFSAVPETVDQSKSFRPFDKSFDPRAAHVSLSAKRLRRLMPQAIAMAVV